MITIQLHVLKKSERFKKILSKRNWRCHQTQTWEENRWKRNFWCQYIESNKLNEKHRKWWFVLSLKQYRFNLSKIIFVEKNENVLLYWITCWINEIENENEDNNNSIAFVNKKWTFLKNDCRKWNWRCYQTQTCQAQTWKKNRWKKFIWCQYVESNKLNEKRRKWRFASLLKQYWFKLSKIIFVEKNENVLNSNSCVDKKNFFFQLLNQICFYIQIQIFYLLIQLLI